MIGAEAAVGGVAKHWQHDEEQKDEMQAAQLFLAWGSKSRGPHFEESTNDNKNTVLDLVSLAASIRTCGCVPENISFQKIWGVKIPCLTFRQISRGSFDPP